MLESLRSILAKLLKKKKHNPAKQTAFFLPADKTQNFANIQNVSHSSIGIHQTFIIMPGGDPSSLPSDFREKIIEARGLPSVVESNSLSDLDKEIDEAVKDIKAHNFKKAKAALYELLGKAKSNEAKFRAQLVRVYNNLGVCFNQHKEEDGNFDEAIKFFNWALQINPSFYKAKINLAAAYLNKRGKENFKRSFELVAELWAEYREGDDAKIIISVLLMVTFHHKSLEEALKLFEVKGDSQRLILESEDALFHVVNLYLEKSDFSSALDCAGLILQKNPHSFQATAMQGLIFCLIAQKNSKQGYYQVVPKFEDLKVIKSALESLETALSLFGRGENVYLLEEVKLATAACYVWLNQVKDAKYEALRRDMNTALLNTESGTLLNVLDFATFLEKKEYQAAYTTFISSSAFNKLSYSEKERVASILLLHGAVEEAENLFTVLEKMSEAQKDFQFWLTRSAAAMLQKDKNKAILYAAKGKELASGAKEEKSALSHYNAVMMRYADMGESERLVKGMTEYNSKFPEDKALTAIPAVDDDGNPSKEIRTILIEQKKWFENIRNTFLEQPVISYALEKAFKRTYAEVISTGASNGDPHFVFQFNFADNPFKEINRKNLQEAQTLIFDYASLLNLSKMGLLGYLDSLGKKISVSKKLFRKIQNELLVTEIEDVRRLWDWLRKNRQINFFDSEYEMVDWKDWVSIFDPWLMDSLQVAKSNSATFITDDLRLLLLVRSKEISALNSLTILFDLKAANRIDEKIYSECIGDYAERCYRFIRYSGADLFQIVLEDKGKITFRSYFLVNEIFAPGSDIRSFSLVFKRFLYLFLKTGSLSEDKASWLIFFTMIINRLIQRNLIFKENNSLIKTVLEQDFMPIWILAIEKGTEEELTILKRKLNVALLGEVLTIQASKLKSKIENRLNELQAKKAKKLSKRAIKNNA